MVTVAHRFDKLARAKPSMKSYWLRCGSPEISMLGAATLRVLESVPYVRSTDRNAPQDGTLVLAPQPTLVPYSPPARSPSDLRSRRMPGPYRRPGTWRA